MLTNILSRIANDPNIDPAFAKAIKPRGVIVFKYIEFDGPNLSYAEWTEDGIDDWGFADETLDPSHTIPQAVRQALARKILGNDQ